MAETVIVADQAIKYMKTKYQNCKTEYTQRSEAWTDTKCLAKEETLCIDLILGALEELKTTYEAYENLSAKGITSTTIFNQKLKKLNAQDKDTVLEKIKKLEELYFKIQVNNEDNSPNDSSLSDTEKKEREKVKKDIQDELLQWGTYNEEDTSSDNPTEQKK